MRAHGTLASAGGLAPEDHVCWVYDDPAGFAAAVREYLADGLARGERLMCVGDRAIDAAASADGPLRDTAALVDRGTLRLLPTVDAYGTGGVVPERQLDFYAGATDEALADGYAGLRVAAEVTALVSAPDRLPEHLRWEHLADGYIATSAMSALCAYARPALGDDTVADLEAVHPLVRTRAGATPFRVFFDGDRMVVAGSVDVFGADRLLRTFATSHVAGPAVTVDLRRLDFVDARGATAFATFAKRLGERGTQLCLVAAPPVFRRVWETLGFAGLPNVTVTGARA